jgi:hypothetical protein
MAVSDVDDEVRPVTQLRVGRRRVLTVLLTLIAAVNVANAACIVLGADSDGTTYWLLALERNPATWLSAALLAVTAMATWLVGRDRIDRRWWTIVAAVLTVLSLDEIATFHERLGAVPLVPGIGNRGWAGFGVLLVAVIGVRLLPWALSLDPMTRFGLLLGGGLFVTGAVGFEVAAGNHELEHGHDTTFWVLSSIEEDLELAGVVVVLWAALGLLARRPGVRVGFAR